MTAHLTLRTIAHRLLLTATFVLIGSIESRAAEPASPAKPSANPKTTAKSKPVTKPKSAAAKSPGAKKKAEKNALPAMEPPAPFIDFVYPAGGQHGKTVTTTVTGTNLAGASAVRMTGGGVKVSIVEIVNPTTLRLSVAMDADAELDPRDLRVTTPGGVSNRFRFTVGELPEINEIEPNSEPARAQRIASLPIVVNGQLFEADRDYYRFDAKAGQTLVCEVQARAILPFMADAVPGWCDACLSLYDAKGKEVSYVDDSNLKPDPVLIYQIPKDGEYLLAIKDILYRGRGNFVYRLKMGMLPYITHIFPLGGPRNSTTHVKLYGVNLPESTLAVAVPADSPAVQTLQVARDGVVSNGVPFAASDTPEIVETEPNDSIAQAQRVTTPTTINGRIGKPGDVDYFVFHAKAQERLVIEVIARRLDSPLDSILTLFGPNGQELAENDDTVDPSAALATHHADSRLAYTFPAAGDYRLRIGDIQGHGGVDYAYRLVIAPPRPDFTLRITPDNLRVGQGETTVVTVYALRADGFNGPIDVAMQNLPRGFVTSDAVIPAGQNETRFTITAPRDAPIGVCGPTIVGRAKLDKNATQPVLREAVPAETMMQAFAYQHNVPTKEFSLAVVEPSSFHPLLGSTPGKILEIPQGGEIQIPVKVFRKEGFRTGLSLGQFGRTQGLTVKSFYLPPDRDEATITVTALPQAQVGLVQNLILSASLKAKVNAKNDQSIVRVAPAIAITIVAGQPKPK